MTELFASAKKMSLDDISLAYVESGEGEPVVLVHGSASDLRTWSGQIPALAARHRVIAYSRRYARPNDDIAAGADDPIDVHVDDLAGLLVALKAAPAHLVGHSWGGLIVLLLAMRRPEMVRSMTLIEPPVLTLFVDVPPKISQLLPLLFRDPRTATAIIKFGATVIGPTEKAFQRGDDKAAMDIFGKGVLGQEKFAQLSDARRAQIRENRAVDKAQILGHNFPSLKAEEVRRVNIRTMLLAGTESPILFQRLSDTLHDLLPEAQLCSIPGASHIVQEDAPAEANSRLLDFLNPSAGRG